MLLRILILCVSLLAFVAATPQWHHAKDGHNYLIEPELKYTWPKADKECNRRGLKLVAIQDAVSNAALDALLRTIFKQSPDLWIGATDRESAGGKQRPFYWSLSGKRVSFANWANGQPDNAKGNEHCVHIYKAGNYQWNDAKCSSMHGYICEGRFFE